MAEQKWFVLPAEFSPGCFDVIRWTQGHVDRDTEHDGSCAGAQARADQLNAENRDA